MQVRLWWGWRRVEVEEVRLWLWLRRWLWVVSCVFEGGLVGWVGDEMGVRLGYQLSEEEEEEGECGGW